MAKNYKRGLAIKEFILRSVSKKSQDIAGSVISNFGISRQAVHRYIKELVDEGYLYAEGNTRNRRYTLRVLHESQFSVPLDTLEEDRLWRERVADIFKDVPKNVFDIWQYSFTEMANNAIDHSSGTELTVAIKMDGFFTHIILLDNGVGIFKKIKESFALEDERNAVLELAKGKLTTDPESHTGEGIFFTSRLLDDFTILSGEVYFSHEYGKEEDWILERELPKTGTSVFMSLANNSKRASHEVFERFASEQEDYGFTKTVVPVRLVRHGVENLVSRSQAKRLLARVDKFKTVILDFQGIDSIGRAFADEIFRVFKNNNPGILLIPINTVPYVDKIIALAEK